MPFIAVDWSRESYPYAFYRRVGFLSRLEVVRFQVEYGYHYLAKRIVAKWDTTDAGATFLSPQIFVTVTDLSTSRKYSPVPIPLSLVTSPGGGGVVFATIGANKVLTATAKRGGLTENYLFKIRSVFSLEITGATIASAVNSDLNHPSYLDIFIEGRNYPERSLPMWGKGVTA